MNNLHKYYKEKVVPSLQKSGGYKNALAVPTVTKVVLNVGLGKGLKEKDFLEAVKNTLTRITGQKPVETLARKSISNFKIRSGMVVGVKVTLRGVRMWDFLEKLVKITLPRVRDFRGLALRGIDARGNYTIGFDEYIAFPEVKQDEGGRSHGLQVIITTNAQTREAGEKLFIELGFPFQLETK